MSRSIFIIGLILLMFRGISAETIKVPTDYATIQAGIDAAANGDTVLVADSTYYENINFKGKAITVASYFLMDGDTTHIDSTIINGSQPSDPNMGSVVSFVSGEDTTSVVYGFTITGGTGTMYDGTYRVGGGIYLAESGARIAYNKIVFNIVNHTADCDGGGIGYWPQTNSSARYLIIEDNVVESNSLISSNGESYLNGGGIYIVKGRIIRNTIRYNSVSGQPRFSGGGGIGAGCENTDTRTLVVITGNTITHNHVNTPGYAGGWGGGIDVVNCNVQILENTISHNEAGGSQGVGAGIRLWRSKEISLIKDNAVSFNSVTTQGWTGGIELMATEGVQVLGNRIEGNNGSVTGGGGIDESGCSGNLIKGNLIKGNTGGWVGGIFATNSILINNIIVENEARCGGGIFCYYHPSFTSNLTQIINNTITQNVADTAGGIAIYKSNAVVMNNICWGNTAAHGPEIEMWGGTLNAAYSDIRYGAAGIVIDSAATINWLDGNIVTDPYFADTDYRLSENSFCLGAGTQSMNIGGQIYSAPDTDYEGNIRPNPPASNPDMGAFESPYDGPGGLLLVPENYASIQDAIDAAVDGNVVLVKDSTYYENIDFKGKAITVGSYFYMDGDTNHVNSTVINGSQPSNPDSGSVVFFISGEDTNSVLCGFTITGGSGTETNYWDSGTQLFGRAGGGIFCFYSGARILNSKIINNALASPDKRVLGGGIAALPFESTAYVVLKDNRIMYNTVTANTSYARGGGVELFCNAILSNNLISYNSVVHNATTTQATGGGLECRSLFSDRRNVIVESNQINHNSIISYSNHAPAALGGGVTIRGSQGRFAKNEVSHNEIWVNSDQHGSGAGMEILGVPDTFIVEANIIRGNAVKQGNGHGGGINIANQASPTFINNIIEGNSATNGGGFIISGNSVVKLINNTIVNNLATSGGGICTGSTSSTSFLMNSIIWGNQASTNPAIHINTGTIDVAYSDVEGGYAGTGNISKEPMLRGENFILSDSSSCIGAGITEYNYGDTLISCPPTDYLGNPRPNPADSLPDIGACESSLASPVVGLRSPANNLPVSFDLKQNYPNPFNPVTAISFDLPKTSQVTLMIFNILGEEVVTLVSDQLPAGSYVYEWDASGIASGVYLYRLSVGSLSGESEEFIETKKMILMR